MHTFVLFTSGHVAVWITMAHIMSRGYLNYSGEYTRAWIPHISVAALSFKASLMYKRMNTMIDKLEL